MLISKLRGAQMVSKNKYFAGILIGILFHLAGCQPPQPAVPLISISQAIPPDAVKMTPEMDLAPPILHSDNWQQPIPLPGAPTTAGLEDSPFITPEGNTLYYFFTPDADVPAERQIVDGATGIYVSHWEDGQWGIPERIILQDTDKLAMDGCIFVQGQTIWFCSVREGNAREIDIWTATYQDGEWRNWQNAGEPINVAYQVGEMHITSDGQQMYYHSYRPGGLGGMDIWVIHLVNGAWEAPENVSAVNTNGDEGWPYISPDKRELWFTRTYQGSPAIFRSLWTENGWGEPEMIVSQFAGEPTLDAAGNLYFTHHYIVDGQIREADIYVAYKKTP
jgi:hypothetical protein